MAKRRGQDRIKHNVFKSQKRYDQIARWLQEDIPEYIKNTKNLILAEGKLKSFRYFRSIIGDISASGNDLINSRIRNTELRYLIAENFRLVGKEKTLTKLYKVLFDKVITKHIKEKSRIHSKRVERTKRIKEMRKYKLMVTPNTEKVFILNRDGSTRPEYRNINTGKFVKKPKGVK